MENLFRNTERFEMTKKLFEVVNHSTDDFLFIWDIAGDVNWFFGDVEKDFDLKQNDDMTNTTEDMLKVIHPKDRAALKCDLDLIAKGEKDIHDMSYRWVKRDGEIVWVNCRGSVIKSADGKPHMLVGRVSEEAMRHLYNPLTGLWNKVKLREDLSKVLSKKYGYLMVIDIDHLAAINLSHGRDFGDKILKEVAGLLENIPSVVQGYHIDHNHFAAVIKTDNHDEVRDVFDYISDKMKSVCTFTAGAVPVDSDVFMDVSQLIDSVNVTFKRAKQKSKNRIEFFSAEEIEKRIESLTLLEELKSSVSENFEGFELYYQPQVKGGSYELYGVEALLRYTSKTRGRLFPNIFIPLLEQSRLIEQVGLWVLETALRQCKAWRKNIPDLRVSVNFSTVQFEDKHLSEKIVDILKETDMQGDALTVEITESIQYHKNENFDNNLRLLKEYGIGIAIDDFGTGYSNLGYLKQIDIDEIKVDRSFVSGIERNTYNYKLVSNVMEFAKANSIRICCEGVETNEELATLEGLGPDKIQGFLFDMPRPVGEIEEKYMNSGSKEYNGRLTFIEEIYRYKEKIGVIHFDRQDILRDNNIGLWVIRFDENKKHYEMHVDDTMEQIIGINFKYTPAECYEYWYDRIHPDFVGYVNKNISIMVDEGKMVQLKYNWIHPNLGEVSVRFSGRRVQDADGMVVIEGYHRILTDVEGA